MQTEHIIQHWNRIREGLDQTIAKFNPEDLDFRPIEGGYSVREIILHIAQEEYGEIQYGLTRQLGEFPGPFSAQDHPTLPSLTSLLERIHSETLDYLQSLERSALKGDFRAQWGETKPLVDFVLHVIEHEIHHRGELSLILGLLGRKGLDA